MPALKNLLTTLLITLLFFSCKDSPKTENKEKTPAERIREYYANTPKLKLPFTWYNTKEDFPMEFKGMEMINDSILFPKKIGATSLRGVFPDISRYFGFFFVRHGDDLTPFIATFDKKGKLISYESLGFGCGSDCGYSCGDGEFTMEKNLTFHSKVQRYSADCDSIWNIIPPIIFSKYQKNGKISSNGKVSEGKDILVEKRTIDPNSSENPFK